jgi:hypothetical protein
MDEDSRTSLETLAVAADYVFLEIERYWRPQSIFLNIANQLRCHTSKRRMSLVFLKCQNRAFHK